MDGKTVTSSNLIRGIGNTLLRMADKQLTTVKTLADNLNYLMDKHGLSEAVVGKRSGVSGKTVNNMRNGRTKVTIENAEKVAQVFGLSGWQLLIPDFPRDLIENRDLITMVEGYAFADTDGRNAIARVAEREATYAKSKKDPA